MKRLFGAISLLLVSAGCTVGSVSGEAPKPIEVTPSALGLEAVDWKGKDVDVGKTFVVAETDDATFVFSDHGALTVVGGVVATDEPSRKTWADAANVPAADGRGRWVLAADGDGHVVRALPDGTLDEDVADRYGLLDRKVHTIVPLGATRVAFGYDGGFAVADGTNILRFTSDAFAHAAGGLGRVVGVSTEGVEVYDALKNSFFRYPLPGVRAATIDGNGKVAAITASTLYLEDVGGLAPVHGLPAGELTALATSGDRLWFVLGTELGTRDAQGVSLSTGANIASGARLIGSSSGDVWISTNGSVSRFSVAGGSPALREWQKSVRPIFERSCSGCHLPGGTAGFTLASYDDWVSRRDTIQDRVVVQKNMPPAGTFLADEDRAAIGAWIKSTQ
ncbi:MAG: c-type cytochrome [Polyangiales bacterium]